MEMNKKSGTIFKSFNLKTKDVWTSGDILCEVGTYNFSMLIPNSKNTIDDYGKYLTIYQKQKDGSWKIKADMWNTDTNPWATMQENQKK
jgi:ketosteroid isomerase-like protein